jgi:hypothetical protein
MLLKLASCHAFHSLLHARFALVWSTVYIICHAPGSIAVPCCATEPAQVLFGFFIWFCLCQVEKRGFSLSAKGSGTATLPLSGLWPSAFKTLCPLSFRYHWRSTSASVETPAGWTVRMSSVGESAGCRACPIWVAWYMAVAHESMVSVEALSGSG